MTIRSQVLYPDSVADADIIIPKKRKWLTRPEDKLQIQCVAILRERGIPFLIAQPERLNAPPQRRDFYKKLGILGNSGHCEIVVYLKTRVLSIELKAENGRMSADQYTWRNRITTLGHSYIVARTVEQFCEIIGL